MNPVVQVCVVGLFAALLVCETYSAPLASEAKQEKKKSEDTKRTEDKRGSISAIPSDEEALQHLAAAQDTPATSDNKKKKATPDFIKQAIKEAKVAQSSQNDVISSPAYVAPPRAESSYNTDQLQQLLNEVRSNFDVSPRTVAKYLLIDGDFEGFNRALDEVVAAGVLSPSDVARFREEVSWHYDNLLRNLIESQDNLPEESAYVPYEEYPRDLEYDTYQPSLLEDYDRALSRMQLRSYLDKQASLDALLRRLISDYYSRNGVAESYENYNPVDNALYDDSLSNDYGMPAYAPSAQERSQAEKPIMADKKANEPAAPEQDEAVAELEAKAEEKKDSEKQAEVKKEEPAKKSEDKKKKKNA